MATSRDGVEFDDAMTRIGFGYVHWWQLVTCGLILMLTVNETMGMGIIAPASQCDLDTTPQDRSVIKSAAFCGMICASYFWGYLCDVIGRWKVLMYSTVSTCLFSIVSMFMPTFESFVAFRFFVGLCIAGPGFATMPYLAELCNNKYRPHMINYMSVANAIAMMYCPTLATFILDEDWNVAITGQLAYCPWRFLGLLFTLPGILGLAMLVMLPESPIYLLSVGRDEDAFAVMEWICVVNRNQSLKELGIEKIYTLFTRKEVTEKNFWRNVLAAARPLFRKPYLEKFLLSCTVMFGLVLITNGVGVWFTDMRNRIDAYEDSNRHGNKTVCTTMTASLMNDIEVDAFICDDSFKSFRDSIILGISFIVAYNILGLSLFFNPRRTVFIVPLILSSACGFALAWIRVRTLITFIFVLFLSLPGAVMNLLGGAVIDFVPAFLRGKSMCFCMMFGRLGAICGATILGHFLDAHCFVTFNIFAFVPITCAAIGMYLPM